MSDDEEPEYEVESIVSAQVEPTSRSKKAKLVWNYLVRWKGYTSADDTWEPIDSFNGSEHMVHAFWERANTGGRDINDMSLFKAGEKFLPVGPPRRKPKRIPVETTQVQDEPEKSPATPPLSKTAGKRRRTSPEPETNPNRSVKRKRANQATVISPISSLDQREKQFRHNLAEPQSASVAGRLRSRNRPPSPEVIPDSDEETNGLQIGYLSPGNFTPKTKGTLTHLDASSSLSVTNIKEGVKIPAHRDRQANPLVKVAEDPSLTLIEGTISTKAYAAGRVPDHPSSSTGPRSAASPQKRVKPGPGRDSAGLLKPKVKSSLLTAQKGTLKTIKGNYESTKVAATSSQKEEAAKVDADTDKTHKAIPPSGRELLQLAGLDSQTADTLPDFEDDIIQRSHTSPPQIPSPQAMNLESSKGIRNESFKLARENLFPNKPSDDLSASLTTDWKRPPTIFGPLGLGSEPITKMEQSKSSRLFLNLDTCVSIPIVLRNASQSIPESLSLNMVSNGTPGKFYGAEAALGLLGAIRAGGSSVIVDVDQDASPEDKKGFSHFSSRLQAGNLFVAVAGIQILVFCSSSNTLLAQRLNTNPSLLNEPGSVLVSQVDIENYSNYADATAGADNRRWSQFLATT
ncbi:hypothetical protein M413DRAFT_21571 [Hebeloma cylindrosporum]|uniref:Chromo domain-containing protein n=1 Tax=Hebeloma cylindrosporum TaxID=76867 RepID=A0A0C3CZN5_HEBCY|nr:hypothetical protein M413DRAFT_21571 [Hebeloma cylindrosporum h7]